MIDMRSVGAQGGMMFSQSIELASGTKGFQRELAQTWVDYIPGGRRLVVTFDTAQPLDADARLRNPWGMKAVLAEGCSVVGVKVRTPNWYRDPELHAFFRDPEFRAFCQSFESCLFYGSSMGGYGALAFSAAVPGSTVLAFSPQTTLDAERVPWETRFVSGRRQDWTGDFVDACDSVADAKRIYVVYDPFFGPDVRHVERIQGDNVVRLRAPFSGHISIKLVRDLGNLQKVLRGALAGGTHFFPALVRNRRQSAGYCAQFGKRTCVGDLKRRMFERALEIDPQEFNALHGMMLLHAADRDFSAALACYRRLAVPTPMWQRVVAAECGLLASQLYLDLGDVATAHHTLAETLARAPAVSGLRLALHQAADTLGPEAHDMIAAWAVKTECKWLFDPSGAARRS